MKILLVTTPQSDQNFDTNILNLVEPLALEYIGAGVQEHHDVKLVDLRVPTEPRLKEILESFQPDIIGCGAYTPEVNTAKQICAEAKKVLPEILTVVGGHHATVMPTDFFEDTIDVVVMGEGVHPFKKICACHEKQTGFEEIENIYYRNGKNGEMVFTREQEHPPLDSLPLPARDLTSHLRNEYKNFMAFKRIPCACIRGSVGCIYRCKFCPISGMLNHKMYKHSVDRIMEEFTSIEEPILLWVDDEFFLDSQKAILIAKEIEKARINKYHIIQIRSDTIIKNPKCIEEWAKIGLTVTFVGFESHSETYLKQMRKGLSTSKNKEAIRICHANNIKVRGGFIVQPEFEKKDFKNLGAYVRELKVDMPSYSVYTPLPGTELWEEMKDRLILRNYNLFDMMHTVLPTKLPLKKFYKEYTNLIFKKSMPFKERIKIVKQLDPSDRKQLISTLKKIRRQVKNAYRDYDKHLW